MKRFLLSLTLLALVLQITGCNKAVYVLTVPKEPTEFFDHEIPSEKTFEIGGKTIALTYVNSHQSGIFQYDRYVTDGGKHYRFDQNGFSRGIYLYTIA